MKRAILLAVFVLGVTGQNFAVAQHYLDFTSADTTTFTVGQVESFNVTLQPTQLYIDTFGVAPILEASIPFPSPDGVFFTDNHDGTATLAGTPISAGNFGIVLRAFAPLPPPKGPQLLTQNFGLTVNQGQTNTTVSTDCPRTFTENEPFTYFANALAVGSGFAGGTMTYTQNPGNTTLCSVGIPPGGGCATTSLATTDSHTQDSYLLGASYSGNPNWQPSEGFPIGVTVLSAADVVFRNDVEEVLEGCPAQ